MFKSLLPWKHAKIKVVMVPSSPSTNTTTAKEPQPTTTTTTKTITMDDDRHDSTLTRQQQQLQDSSSVLAPCNVCGRTFLPASLRKHAPVCEKHATKKRKVFDSLKQRIEGTDLALFHQKSYLRAKSEGGAAASPATTTGSKCEEIAKNRRRISKWEEKHLELVTTIRKAKGNSKIMSAVAAKKTPTSLLDVQNSNKRCPHCERQFGDRAFDRHVEWCKEHQTRVQKSPASVLLAKERLEARINYKVPNRPRKPTVKEKYSSSTSISCTNNSFNRSDSTNGSGSKSATPTNSSTVLLSRTPSRRLTLTTTTANNNNRSEHEPKMVKSAPKIGRTLSNTSQSSNKSRKGKEEHVQSPITDNPSSTTIAVPSSIGSSGYNPFESAERQLMELLECDDFKSLKSNLAGAGQGHQRPHTAALSNLFSGSNDNKESSSHIIGNAGGRHLNIAKKTIKSADALSISSSKKDQNTCHKNNVLSQNSSEMLARKVMAANHSSTQDSVAAMPSAADQAGGDDFEIIEHLINDHFSSTSGNTAAADQQHLDSIFLYMQNKRDKDGTTIIGRKLSDDSIDPDLINETDNLSIPEHLDEYSRSPSSNDDMIIPQHGMTFSLEENNCGRLGNAVDSDNLDDHYSVQYDENISKMETTGSLTRHVSNVSSSSVKSRNFDQNTDDRFDNLTGHGPSINRKCQNSSSTKTHTTHGNPTKEMTANKKNCTTTSEGERGNNNNGLLKSEVALRRQTPQSKNANNNNNHNNNNGGNNKNVGAQLEKTDSSTLIEELLRLQEDLTEAHSDQNFLEVDAQMYAEFKLYEENYKKERGRKKNTRKQKQKNEVETYGMPTLEQSPPTKTSDKTKNERSGAVKNKTDAAHPTVLPSLHHPAKRSTTTDSSSASGSENLSSPLGKPAAPASLLYTDTKVTSSSATNHNNNNNNKQRMSKFCHECGNKYPVCTAKFCVECGVKRLAL